MEPPAVEGPWPQCLELGGSVQPLLRLCLQGLGDGVSWVDRSATPSTLTGPAVSAAGRRAVACSQQVSALLGAQALRQQGTQG